MTNQYNFYPAEEIIEILDLLNNLSGKAMRDIKPFELINKVPVGPIKTVPVET